MENKISELMNLVVDGQKQMNERFDTIENKMSSLENKMSSVENKMSSLENKMDSVQEQTAELIEFKNNMIGQVEEINDKLYNIELITASNWRDVTKLKSIK
ncbi:MAG: hypothetical protein U9Q80_07850 [Bacillota bacterium]|nr:hypothetical protein [Bacillota bacterium]